MGSGPYVLLYARAFDRDLDGIPAYDAVIVRTRVAVLAQQPEVEARNRRRLGAPVAWCPEATWQLRVGDYRVLYRVDRALVRVLRLTFKGRKTTEEMGR
jgi:mRNA-degrading endonuclease RelE of RelBE toxin-antitoxin system